MAVRIVGAMPRRPRRRRHARSDGPAAREAGHRHAGRAGTLEPVRPPRDDIGSPGCRCRRRQPGAANHRPRRPHDRRGPTQASRTGRCDPRAPRRRSGACWRVSGGLAAIDPATGTIRKLSSAPPAMAAALAEDQQGVWLVAGIRMTIGERPGGISLRPGEAVTRVEWHPLGDGQPRAVEVPLPVRTIAVSAESIWLTPAAIPGSSQHLVIGETGGGGLANLAPAGSRGDRSGRASPRPRGDDCAPSRYRTDRLHLPPIGEQGRRG